MIDKKMMLYVVIGVIIYALWSAWQVDYAPKKPVSQQTVVSTATIPSVAPATITSGEAANLTPIATKISANRLIKVHTDVLDVAIDTVGGNIVRAELKKYPEKLHSDTPIKLLNDDPEYYYVAQSGLVSAQGNKTSDQEIQYKSEQQEYTLDPTKDTLIVKLAGNNSNEIVVTKSFIFTKQKYDVAVNYDIANKSEQDWSGQFYTQIHRKNFDARHSMFGFSTYTGAAISSADKPYEKVSFSKIEDYAKENKGFIKDSAGGWVAMQQRYFLSVWVPSQDKTYRYFSNYRDGIYTIGLSDSSLVVPKHGSTNVAAKLYIGPDLTENLTPLAHGLDLTVDYGWLWPIAILFFWLLKKIHLAIGNWGWAIVILTILIKLVFYKLSESSCRSMAKMRELMPKMQALKERYGDDKQKLHQATMELYKREKINPLNLGGCLPMLVQIPFFIALYYVLIGAVELRHAPFMFWIQDLSAHDSYYILPLLMGASMFLQQKMNPTSADPAQAKMMMFMPVIFTFFFLNFPAGLVLYWLINNCLAILQQWYINKKLACAPNYKK